MMKTLIIVIAFVALAIGVFYLLAFITLFGNWFFRNLRWLVDEFTGKHDA